MQRSCRMNQELLTASTPDAAASDKPEAFRSTALRVVGGPVFSISAEPPFAAKLQHCSPGPIMLCELSATPHRVILRPSPSEREGDSHIRVVLQLRGKVMQKGGSYIPLISAGQWCVYPNGRQPVSMTSVGDVRQRIVMLPRVAFSFPDVDMRDGSPRVFSGTSGVGRLAFQFINSVFDEVPALPAHCEQDVVDTMVHLIRLCMIESWRSRTDVPGRTVFTERLKSYIENHLHDPDVSIDGIALALKCSKRYLHKIFEDQGTTISDYIWRMRLQRCREDLMNPAKASESILDIALDWGFKCPSHFSKAFRQAFGTTPRRSRAGLPS
jgi:AraC-like DNA-binding protein